MLDRIMTRYLQSFFFSLHFSRARENLWQMQSLLTDLFKPVFTNTFC